MGGRGGAPAKLAEELGNCGFDVVDTQEIYFVPTAEEDDASYELGKKLAQACKEL
jgi:flavorubredoxin